jgi:glycerate dehydrogenase
MKIVVLDGYTLNPGDLSWDGLRTLGECVVYDRTPDFRVVERLAGADAALTNKTRLSRQQLEQLPELKYIGVLATGYNVVDIACAGEKGITVTNVPAYSTNSVAQHVFAHLLELCQQVGLHSLDVKSGGWAGCEDFCYRKTPLTELSGLTFGVVGLGAIGQAVASIARAFGMKVIAYIPRPKILPKETRLVDLDTLFRESDVISLHCPLNPDTERLVNAKRLGMMKPNAFLINTGRGGLVDEAALAEALNGGKIAGAGVDVLSTEPPREDNPLLAAKNIFITPHLAWASRAARSRLMDVAVSNIKAFLAEKPQNVIGG